MRAPRPFRIDVEPSVLTDLDLRLRRARLKPISAKTDWSHGTDPGYLSELISYWRTAYDWREQEQLLNGFGHFKAELGDVDLHFIHERGDGPDPMPLLLLHGWPDSFYRFNQVVRPFTRAGFDVVVPSLPGFGFTTQVKWPAGRSALAFSADVVWRLMTQVLGYSRFAVCGGDGGSVIAQRLAIDHPGNVIGVHLTDLGFHATFLNPEGATPEEKQWLETQQQTGLADGAYLRVQLTKPRCLAPALNDSPVALASWFVDRFHAWAGSARLEESFTRDELLTNLMIYWVTETAGPSVYTYYTEGQYPTLQPNERVERPVGVALFPKDIGGIPPRSAAERILNVQRWTELKRGGHFAAWEEPELFVEEVSAFFDAFRTQPAPRSSHVEHAATL